MKRFPIDFSFSVQCGHSNRSGSVTLKVPFRRHWHYDSQSEKIEDRLREAFRLRADQYFADCYNSAEFSISDKSFRIKVYANTNISAAKILNFDLARLACAFANFLEAELESLLDD